MLDSEGSQEDFVPWERCVESSPMEQATTLPQFDDVGYFQWHVPTEHAGCKPAFPERIVSAGKGAAGAFQLLLAELDSEHQQELSDLQKVYERRIAALCSERNESKSSFLLHPGMHAQEDVRKKEVLDVRAIELDIHVDILDKADAKAPLQPEHKEAELKASNDEAETCNEEAEVKASCDKDETCENQASRKRRLKRPWMKKIKSAIYKDSAVTPKKHVMYQYLKERIKPGSSKMSMHKIRCSVHDFLSVRGQNSEFISEGVSETPSLTHAESKMSTSSGIARAKERAHNCKRRANRIIHSPSFEALCAALIFANAIFLGIHTDFIAKADSIDDVPKSFAVINQMFSVWFLAELILRITASGLYGFVFSRTWFMNWFDLLIVIMDWMEVILELFAASIDHGIFNTTIFRMLRVLRVARALRVVKLVKFFKEFRLMVLSVLRSGALLLWSLALLSMIIFVFGIFLTLNVTTTVKGVQVLAPHEELLEDAFGTLTATFYTLFKAISGGISWQEVCDPLLQMDQIAGLVFVVYIFFTIFSMLNIINGIFVDYAISSVQNDQDEVIQAQLTSDESVSKQLRDVFMQADKDGSGDLSFDELETHLSDPRVIKHFSLLGIEISEARGMFKLLDLSRSGHIGVDEFVFGCMRIKGAAKTVDLLTLMYENKRMCQMMRECFAEIMEILQAKCPDYGVSEAEPVSPKQRLSCLSQESTHETFDTFDLANDDES